MTLDELLSYRVLQNRIDEMADEYFTMKARAEKVTPILSGMPHQTGVSDRVGDLTAEIADLSNEILKEIQNCIKKQKEIEAYIEGIPERKIRILFQMKCIEGKEFEEIGEKLGVTRMTIHNWYKDYIRRARLY